MEPEYTCHAINQAVAPGKTFKNTIDYILYKYFKVKSVTPSIETITRSNNIVMPNKDEPSDHLPVSAIFEKNSC